MIEYSVVVHHAEEGGHWVEVPALSGCYSQDETLEEALENVKEAIAVYLESLRAHGDPVPPPTQEEIIEVKTLP